MKINFVAVDLARWDQAPPGDLLAVGFYTDLRPLRGAAGLLDWRFDGRLSTLIVGGNLSGVEGEQLLMPSNDRLPWRWTLAFGLGPSAELDDARAARAIQRTLRTMRGLGLAAAGAGVARTRGRAHPGAASVAAVPQASGGGLARDRPGRHAGRDDGRAEGAGRGGAPAWPGRQAARGARARSGLRPMRVGRRRPTPDAESGPSSERGVLASRRRRATPNFARGGGRAEDGDGRRMALSLDVAIQQFLDHVRVERELAPATVSAYGSDLADFAKFAAARPVAGVGGGAQHRDPRLPGAPDRAGSCRRARRRGG